jgi:phosphohistidine phosphatase SixA
MKHLFIARHGSYSGPHNNHYYLNSCGINEIKILSKDIKEILNGGSVKVISSVIDRAVESSEVLIKQLGLSEFEKIPYLGDCVLKNDKLIEIVNQRKYDIDGIIMMGHFELTKNFPIYYIKTEFGKDEYIRDLEKGEAIHLNLEEKTYQILPNY